MWRISCGVYFGISGRSFCKSLKNAEYTVLVKYESSCSFPVEVVSRYSLSAVLCFSLISSINFKYTGMTALLAF